MMGFVLVAVALVVVALIWLLPTLLRRHDAIHDVVPAAANLAIFKDQLAELERDVGNGTLSPRQYQQAREDLERRALEETRGAEQVRAGPPTITRWTALALLLVIPLGATLLYFLLGSPGVVSVHGSAASQRDIPPQEVEAMVARLAARLEKTPEDGAGWALLARSYVVMQRYQEAAHAYARAAALVKDDADLLADYADALAMSQGRQIDGKVLQIVDQALKIDPGQWKALAMAGSAAFERKDYKKAIGYWERLLQRAEPGSEFARTVMSNIEEAQQLGGIKPGTATKPLPPAAATVQGTVKLGPALKADPSDTVLIYARAAQGPRVPLAIIRRQVKDLPLIFSLDDSQAMAAGMKLSSFAEVVVTARVSKAATAQPQSGDLQGTSQTVKVGARNVAVVIDTIIP